MRLLSLRSLLRAVLSFLFLGCVLPYLGCVGATRLPVRSRGPEGTSIQKNEMDLSFLQSGSTSREDVVSKLHAIDTAYSNPRLFWGRWSQSKWGYWWIVAGGGPGGGGGVAGDAARIWHVHNLLVTFDEKGVMQTQKVVDDDHTLWRTLHSELANQPPLDLSEPITLSLGNADPPTLTLSKDAIHVERRKAEKSFDVSPLKVTRFSHHKYGPEGHASSAATSCHKLHLAEKTRSGKSFSFCAKPGDVAIMFQYLHEYGAAKMSWE